MMHTIKSLQYNSRSSLLKRLSTTNTKSWVPTSDSDLQKVTINAWIHEVAEQQRAQATRVVPWFLKNMPASYFKSISNVLQSQHIQAMTTVREFMTTGESMSLKMVTPDKENSAYHISFINNATQSGSLNSQIVGLNSPAEDHKLANVNVFSSLDNTVVLNVFTFVNAEEMSKKTDISSNESSYAQRILDFVADMKAGKYASDPTVPTYSEAIFGKEAMDEYLKKCSLSYAQKSNPRRFMIQKEMYEKLRGTDGSAVHIEPHYNVDDSNAWISIAAANVLPEVLLRLCSGIISARGFDIKRAHLDSVADYESSTAELTGNVTMLRILVGGEINLSTNKEFANVLSLDLKRCKWLDNKTTELGLKKFPELGLNKAEVITALVSMLHGPLYKENPRAFSSIQSILQSLESEQTHIDVAAMISQLFLDRFNPDQSNQSLEKYSTLTANISSKLALVQNEAVSVVLSKMLQAVHATLRTNFYNEDRYALSLRVDPKIMATGNMGTVSNRPLPFGIFFVHGRNFNAFHNRFRDIARGGLRIVTPSNSDQYALESTRQFDEVYGLSYAQQLKNKDIPEGGAKGVILVNTPSIEVKDRFFAMRKAVKAFADSMLDLIVKDSVKNLVDFYNKDELIYFGPDEQIIPSDIEWIVNRAAVRGYPIPAAFMSSKRENGINHKEFGVTSEGIVVYVDVALRRSLNIDPTKDSFTLKVTGGPDGDVAGNLIRILFREYGSNCKVVGIADGFGVAEDPEGLDQSELLRLVKESLPITSFDSTKLSSKGICLSATTEEGLTRRNTMHFRVKSDIFVPAGGRPNTINNDNWQNFMDENGVPSSKLIVEGANIFITPEARQKLFDTAKVAIVKDSSANKCGVVTSSCEVQACMLLSKDEFMAIKPELVEDILVQLRSLARLEGELLFREYNNYPGALPHFSERISFAITKVRDAVSIALQDIDPNDKLFQELFPLIKESLPKKLVDVAGDRIANNFPLQYQRNAIASALASKIVYKEGIHLVETQPNDVIADRAFQYYRKEKNILSLLKKIETTSDINKIAKEDKELIKDLLKRGGARASLNIF